MMFPFGPVSLVAEILPTPFGPGDRVALVSSAFGKGHAAIERSSSQEFQLLARLTSYSPFMQVIAPMYDLDLKQHVEMQLSINRDGHGRYSLAVSLSNPGALSWDKVMFKFQELVLIKVGTAWVLLNAAGKEIAVLQLAENEQLTLEIPMEALLSEEYPGWEALIPQNIDLRMTRVGLAQDSPDQVERKIEEALREADDVDRLAAGAIGGEEAGLTGDLIAPRSLRAIANLAPWQEPFVFGTYLGLSSGIYGPYRGTRPGMGPMSFRYWRHERTR